MVDFSDMGFDHRIPHVFDGVGARESVQHGHRFQMCGGTSNFRVFCVGDRVILVRAHCLSVAFSWPRFEFVVVPSIPVCF
jgi:hypothetical protein